MAYLRKVGRLWRPEMCKDQLKRRWPPLGALYTVYYCNRSTLVRAPPGLLSILDLAGLELGLGWERPPAAARGLSHPPLSSDVA